MIVTFFLIFLKSLHLGLCVRHILSTLYVLLTHLILNETKIMYYYYYHLHFIEEKIGTQKGKPTCFKIHTARDDAAGI